MYYSNKIKYLLIAILWVTPIPCLAENSELSIIFAADMPVIGQHDQGTYANLAGAVNHYRKLQSNSLFLFGGNSLGPSPMSSFDSGSHIIDLLNGIEPDAMGVAKREYLFLEEQLSLRAFEAAFPLVASNIFDPIQYAMQDGIEKSVMIKKGPFNIGIMAIIDPKAKDQYLLKRVIVQQISNSIRLESQRLRADGADFIIVMHGTPLPIIDELLQQGIIDLTLLKDPFVPDSALEKSLSVPNKVLLNSIGDIAIVKITALENGQFGVKWHSKSLSSFKPDPAIEAQENDYVSRLDRLMKLPISTISSAFNTSREHIRKEENEFANLITDVMIEHTGADVAIINSGAIRGDSQYFADQLFTRKDLIEELPYRTSIVTLEMTGSAISKSIEDGIADYPLLRGKFPQVSNMKIVFDGNLVAGNRLIDLTVNGEPIRADKLYKVATIDYLYNGGDGYVQFARSRLLPNPKSDSIILPDLVLNAILSGQLLKIKKQNRIIDVSVKEIAKGNN
jgi:2',3'-cyclic-nucleotide 2'-phosphodiesterase (5'-nucleotidase family)